MKKVALLLIFIFSCVCGFAQKEIDFAERFMQLYGTSKHIECFTVSPSMMNKIITNQIVEKSDMKEMLEDIKTARIIYSTPHSNIDDLHQKAIQLLDTNQQRYHLEYKEGNTCLYVRSKGKIFVELILLHSENQLFKIIDFTGNFKPSTLHALKRKPNN